MKELIGTEKQIAWAEEIRKNMLEALTIIEFYKQNEKIMSSASPLRVIKALEDFKVKIENETNATYFINNRNLVGNSSMLGGEDRKVLSFSKLFLEGFAGEEEFAEKNYRLVSKMNKMVENKFYNYK